MRSFLTTLFCCLFLFAAYAQEDNLPSTDLTGRFSLGVRSTQSLFGSSDNSGMGFGGQFKIRLGKRLNTEWFADHIKTDLGGLGHRETAHIGWSVMFYPFRHELKEGAFLPYLLAGHCFDFAKINGYQHIGNSKILTNFETKRWTSAVQIGVGTSYHLTKRFDVSFSAQYMSHLGNDLHVEILEPEDHEVGNYLLNSDDHNQLTMEGHLLLTLSLNYILIR